MMLYNFLAYTLLFLHVFSLFVVSVSFTLKKNLLCIIFVAMKVLILICFVALLGQATDCYHLAN